jgi:hypothetical protein
MKGIIKLSFLVPALIGMTFLSGCGEGDPLESISLRGKISGADWTMRYGKAEVEDIDPNISSFFFSSESTEVDPCDIFFSSLASLQAQLPKETGVYSLPFENQSESVTFKLADGSFLISQSGQVQITSVNGSVVAGSMTARFDDDNFVEGSFALIVCAEE